MYLSLSFDSFRNVETPLISSHRITPTAQMSVLWVYFFSFTI